MRACVTHTGRNGMRTRTVEDSITQHTAANDVIEVENRFETHAARWLGRHRTQQMRRRCVNLFLFAQHKGESLSIFSGHTTPHCVSSWSSVVRLDYASCLSEHVVALRPNRGRVLLFFPSPRG